MKKQDGQTVDEKPQGFFSRLDWSAFWTATLVSFAVYVYTLAPTVSLEDSGELAVAGDYLGVPHPPGYPIWSFISWVLARIFSFVTFRGQPNPSWSIGLGSAIFGALAAGITAMLICRSGRDILAKSTGLSHDTETRSRNQICWIGGVVCSLLFAFSPVMWSQSVIVEVYALNAFFLTLIFLLVYMWMSTQSNRILLVTAFVFGLGLTNYQVLLLAALALVIAIMLKDIELLRDFVIAGIPFVIVIALIKTEKLAGITHPTDRSCFIYMVLNFLALMLAYFFLPRGKTVALCFLLAELGVAFYAYMPIVSELRNPPMNWGYPRTFEGFKHAVSRGQYEKIVPSAVFSARYIEQMGLYLKDLRDTFKLPIAILGFLPFTAWEITIAGRRIKALYAAAVLVSLASVFTVLLPDVPMDKILIAALVLITGVGGATIFVHQVEALVHQLRGEDNTPLSSRILIALIMLGAIGLCMFAALMLTVEIGRITAPLRAGGSITGLQIQHIILIVLAIIAPPLSVAGAFWLSRNRAQLRMSIDNDSQRWIIATLFGFLTMSFVLVSLANLKLDIQDTFIQRVKFISSHALYAFWIGYGLIFGLVFVDNFFRKNAFVRTLSLVTAIALPLIPIHSNFYDEDLLYRYGGAEQNGHDFGWQFGNYQLRGADAITEELSPDEEPLPNPLFPKEMGPDAVFFGGTDPGRFVPTYMIYSARVREDVFLITQNALADNTYMSVMRDLYGDQIWIPAQPDSATAFQRYVEEVRSGKRPKNAQLDIRDGRVQVSGALGVMEINGILAQMIFEHNNYKNDFYVEESYVIPWMYPYSEPHGLIMKINKDHTPLTPERIRKDLDFWDWYTRRLTSDNKFIRDVCARKSFSKLRSAIAGLYANRGNLREAEIAFQEARMLYPLSPEANFRLAQEVYLRDRRIADTRELMTEFGKMDPGNDKVPEMLRQLDNLQKMDERIRNLEKLRGQGAMTLNSAFELAELYLQTQNGGGFMMMMGGIMNTPDLPGPYYLRAAELYRRAGQFGEMDKVLQTSITKIPKDAPPEVFLDIARMYATSPQAEKMKPAVEEYLKRRPSDWRAWLDLASLQIGYGETNNVFRSLDQALRYGGNEAMKAMEQDGRFAPFRNQVLSRARNLIGIPGQPPAMPRIGIIQ